MKFTKMHGIGNDFVMVDTLQDGLPSGDLQSLAAKVNDRRFGIGGDGLILIERGEEAPFKMRMFNPDGSESEMCGNGIRCFAKLLQDHGHLDTNEVACETGAGELILQLHPNGHVRVNMGQARLLRGEIGMTGRGDEDFTEQPLTASVPGLRGTAVSMGNPHVVIFVDDVQAIQLDKIGPELEHYPDFPKRVNVHFVQVIDRNTLIQRTWERGAGITLACGTGACSVGVAAFVTGRAEREVEIRLPGGSLHIEYAPTGEVFMTGPAETVFEGEWESAPELSVV